MKKYTVGEILSTRKVGNIGKHSTLQDVINEFGQPNYIRWDGLYFYNNLVFQINKINKKVAYIGLWGWGVPKRDFDKNIKILIKSDFKKVLKMSIQELKEYLKSYSIEIFTKEDEENLPVEDVKMYKNGVLSVYQSIPLINYYPKDNKYFTEKDPKFEITYCFDYNEITNIDIYFNYRSKRRN